MYNIKVPTTIKQIITIYHRFGIWQNNEENIYRKWARRSIIIILQFTFLPSLAVGALQSDSMDDSMLLSALVLQCSILNAKMWYILLKESDILEFIYDMGVYTIHSHEEFIDAKKKLKRLMNFARFFVGMSFAGGFLLLGFPLISIKSKTLPLNISFPLNWKESIFNFSVAYLYMLILIVLNIASSLITIFIWFLMMNCSIQYRNLRYLFKSSALMTTQVATVPISRQRKLISESGKQNLFLLDLIGAIKIHRNIQEYVKHYTNIICQIIISIYLEKLNDSRIAFLIYLWVKS